jgi:hypothetical protein
MKSFGEGQSSRDFPYLLIHQMQTPTRRYKAVRQPCACLIILLPTFQSVGHPNRGPVAIHRSLLSQTNLLPPLHDNHWRWTSSAHAQYRSQNSTTPPKSTPLAPNSRPRASRPAPSRRSNRKRSRRSRSLRYGGRGSPRIHFRKMQPMLIMSAERRARWGSDTTMLNARFEQRLIRHRMNVRKVVR